VIVNAPAITQTDHEILEAVYSLTGVVRELDKQVVELRAQVEKLETKTKKSKGV